MRRLVDRLSRAMPGLFAGPSPDPFRTLEMQARLTRLAHELDTLGSGARQEFACGFHAHAALLAYDRTLDEACQLAGLPVPDDDGPTRRLMAEAALTQAGWSW